MSVHPEVATIGWGLAEGTAETSDARIVARLSLTQSVRADAPRTLETRFDFADRDHYRATLLEDTGKGFAPLVEWAYARARELSALPAVAAEAATPSERLQSLTSLVGAPRRFVATAEGSARAFDATFEWIPYVKAIRARLSFDAVEGPLGRTVDVYLLRGADASTIRVLAIGESGAIFEGRATPRGDAIDATLRGHDGSRTSDVTLRVERTSSGAWSVHVRPSGSNVESEFTLNTRDSD
ncbi:MAG: hypothetical protein JNM94_17040 [Phycisphaerae bacterium]|nr:hypothetical protein [Phycisphaerae bacterium]